jgi:hypothetical protein
MKATARIFGASLLAVVLLAAGWLAFHSSALSGVHDDERYALPVGQGEYWDVDAALRATVLDRLPTAFEPRRQWLRERIRSDVVPPLSDYTLRVHGETRQGGKRVVLVSGECDPTLHPVAAAPDESTAPSPAVSREGCYFRAAYDRDEGRFVQLSFDDLRTTYKLDRVDCSRDAFKAVSTLAGLAPDVLASLRGLSNLADSGGEINETDAIRDSRLPMRRFALAAVGSDRAVVAVEHGGMFRSAEVWLFERRAGHWDGEPRWRLGAAPDSLQALLHTACVDVPSPPTRGLSAGDLIYGQDEDGSLHLILAAQPGLGYFLRPHVDGAVDEIVGDDGQGKPLSAEERRALRTHLLALRRELLQDQPAYGYLSRYLKALEKDGLRAPS